MIFSRRSYHYTYIPLAMQSIELTRQHPVDVRYSNPTSAGASAGLTPVHAGGRAVYKLVRTSRLYEQIVQQIEESIVKGDLKAGDQLPAERELAQRFGVSRTAVREAVAAMDRAGQDPETYIEADLDFHLALAEGAANPLILSLLDSIVGLLREQRLRIFRVPGGPDRGQLHHKRILEAVEKRDAEKARQAMRAHLSQVSEDSKTPVAKRAP